MTIVYLCLMKALELSRRKERDGRRLRSVNTQGIIVDAAMTLIRKGFLNPTAQQVADEAGMGIRSVFRKFNDKETLFSEMDKRIKENHQELFTTLIVGSLKERIKDLVKIEAMAFEDNIQFIKATLVNKWRYEALEDNYKKNQLQIKMLMFQCLPEIKELDLNIQVTLAAVNSPNFWIELRDNQFLSVAQAKESKILIFEEVLLKK
jgi:AcrR family transcriptional regulator